MSNLESAVVAHCDVAQIKQPVNVGSQQQTVGDLISASFSKRPDMGRIENRQSLFSRHSTPALIEICHLHAEGSLAEARVDESRCSIPRLGQAATRLHWHVLRDSRPETVAIFSARIVCPTRDNVSRPRCGNGYPLRLG